MPYPNNTSTCAGCRLLSTDDLKAPVRVELSDVSRTEPALAILVDKKILFRCGFVFVVTHRYVRSTDQNLPSWVGLVCTEVTT